MGWVFMRNVFICFLSIFIWRLSTLPLFFVSLINSPLFLAVFYGFSEKVAFVEVFSLLYELIN